MPTKNTVDWEGERQDILERLCLGWRSRRVGNENEY